MNPEIQKTIEELETLLAKIHPLPWEWSANYPFYVDVSKPRPSLSKHDYDNRRPTYWHSDDGYYMSAAVHSVPKLIAEIKRLEGLLNEKK